MNEARPLLDVQEHGGIGLVAVRGDLSVFESAELRDVLQSSAACNDVTLVDLTQTDFMDATALGVMVGALKAARAAGHSVELIAPADQGSIRTILRITGIGKLFVVHDTPAAALAEHGISPTD